MPEQDATDRLPELRQRIATLARREQPGGLTEPDPDTPEERWDAAQVWAHIAEFVGYWHQQMADVISKYDGEPVPFGRTKLDVGRIGAIEAGRHRQISDLASVADGEIAALEGYLQTLDSRAWQARGLHPTRGVMDVPQMVERFITGHLDEHAKQLEGLAQQA
jgi:alpha-L-fucosidase